MAEEKRRVYHKQADIDATNFVIEHSEIKYDDENRENLFENLVHNSQTSLLSTKYNMIKVSLQDRWDKQSKVYTDVELDRESSRAYMYAKLGPTNFGKIKAKTNSEDVLDEVFEHYTKGFKFIEEATFMGLTDIGKNIKWKMAGVDYIKKYGNQTAQVETSNISGTESRIYEVLGEIAIAHNQLETLSNRLNETKTQMMSMENSSTGIQNIVNELD